MFKKSSRFFHSTWLAALILALAACSNPTATGQPDQFTFQSVTDAEPGEVVESNTITITGSEDPLPASVTGPGAVLFINGDQAGAGAQAAPGDTLFVRMPASNDFGTTTTARVTVGTTSAEFRVTTRAESTDPDPDPFEFQAVEGAELGAIVDSNEVTLGGFTGSVDAGVTGGDAVLYINDVPAGADAEVTPGDTIFVRMTASTEFATTITATVTVGAEAAEFSVTTRAEADPPAGLEITSFRSEVAGGLPPGEEVVLSWTIAGIADSLELDIGTGGPIDVTGQNSYTVTTPENQPSVTYTLTATNDDTAATDVETLDLDIPLWVCVDNTYPITFENEFLEAAVRSTLGVVAGVEITCAQMQAMTELIVPVDTSDPEGGPINSLVGIQHATGLVELDAQFNRISDITPIANLTNLEVINFDQNHILDLSPLENLTALREIGFWDNGPEFGNWRDGITDISVLSNLENLETVYISDNRITSLQPLAGLPNLRVLFAIRNRLTDLSPLTNMTTLRTVRVGFQELNGAIDNAAALATLPDLTWLELQFTGITDLSFLSDLDNLYSLNLSGMRLESIAPLFENDAFPDEGVPAELLADPLLLGVDPPEVPSLDVSHNCLETEPGSDTALGIAALVASGVTVVGYTEELQQSCGPHVPDPGEMDLMLQLLRESGGYR